MILSKVIERCRRDFALFRENNPLFIDASVNIKDIPVYDLKAYCYSLGEKPQLGADGRYTYFISDFENGCHIYLSSVQVKSLAIELPKKPIYVTATNPVDSNYFINIKK